ncbi:MAG: hypothetical protein ACQEQM_00365 [Thermoplasmatota archaeon]
MKAMNKKLGVILSVILIALIPVSLATTSIAEESGPIDGFDPPVDGGEMFRNRTENAASHGAATFLKVEDYEPWAALVINAGDPRGVDEVTASFENDTLRIEAQDSNSTNHVTILINKEFADEYLADAESDLEIETSDAVNYDGLENSNSSAGEGAVYVFHIEHFSTQWFEITSSIVDIDPPVEGGETFRNTAQNAASNGAASFLWVEDYKPWAALVINAGDQRGVDAVTASFENDTLRIEAQDSNSTNHVTILINKEFADEYLADAESDLEIETSDAVNYDGLENSNSSAGGGAVYVFHIEHFSTQWFEISAEESIPFIGIPLMLMAGAIPVVYYYFKKKE